MFVVLFDVAMFGRGVVVKFWTVVGIAVSGIVVIEVGFSGLYLYCLVLESRMVYALIDLLSLLMSWLFCWSWYHFHSCRDSDCLINHCPNGCRSFCPFPLALRYCWSAAFHARHDFFPGLGCIGHACLDRRGLVVFGLLFQA